MNKYGIIYKITNKVNGKIYIGKTVQEFERRCQSHRYKSCVAFNNAINSYGWDNFEKEEFICSLSEDYLSILEEQTIKTFNSIVPNGYNIIKIDNGLNRYSQETKNKISEAKKKYYSKLEVPTVAATRVPHQTIDNVVCKRCYKCETYKSLDLFYKDKNRWDGLASGCKACNNELNKSYKPKLTPEELAASYKNRQDSEKQKRIYDNNPELRTLRAKQRAKPIIGTNVVTGEEIEFSSAKEAGNHGFVNTRIGECIKSGKEHRGYTWKFKQNV